MEHSNGQKQYAGDRTSKGFPAVAVINLKTNQARPLPIGLGYVNHSPTGFEWGYLGSGPAQLAFAILLDHFGDPAPARLYYQSFKHEVVAGLNFARWSLTTDQISQAIGRIRHRLEREESA